MLADIIVTLKANRLCRLFSYKKTSIISDRVLQTRIHWKHAHTLYKPLNLTHPTLFTLLQNTIRYNSGIIYLCQLQEIIEYLSRRYKMPTDLDQRSQNSYNAACNGVLSHGAPIMGIRIFADNTHRNKCKQNASMISAAFQACLSLRSARSRCRWHTHRTCHGYFGQAKPVYQGRIQVWADPAPAPSFDSQIMQIQPFFGLYQPFGPLFFANLYTRPPLFTNPASAPVYPNWSPMRGRKGCHFLNLKKNKCKQNASMISRDHGHVCLCLFWCVLSAKIRIPQLELHQNTIRATTKISMIHQALKSTTQL